MANDKFLDYAGLSRLVEKIKNTYTKIKHTHTQEDIQSVKHTSITWDGDSHNSEHLGFAESALIPELGANRFFGITKGVTITYSKDGGETWLDYGATQSEIQNLFLNGSDIKLFKDKDYTNPEKRLLRITIDTNSTDGADIYTQIHSFYLNISTSGSNNSYVEIATAQHSTPDVFSNKVDKTYLSGWSGGNYIVSYPFYTYGKSSTQSQYIRFTFGCESVYNTPTYDGLHIMNIKAFGDIMYNYATWTAKYGVPYKIYYGNDNTPIVDFNTKPSYVLAASNYLGKVNGHNIQSDVPANAKFTDTVYTPPETMVEWGEDDDTLVGGVVLKNAITNKIQTLGLGQIGQVLTIKDYYDTQNTSARLPEPSKVIKWADPVTPIATSDKVGGVKSATAENIIDRTYNLYVDSDGVGYVKVPWVNTTYSAATSSTLGLVKTGSNITNSNGTISLTKDNVTNALGYTPPTTNTTYSNATVSKAGLMSSNDKYKLDVIQGVDYTTLNNNINTNTYSNSIDWAPLEHNLISLGQVMNLYNKLLVPIYDKEDISGNGCDNYPDSQMKIDLTGDILEIFLTYNSTGDYPTPNMFKVCANLFTLMGKCNTSAEEPVYRGYFYDGMQSYVPYIAYVATENGETYSMNFVPEEQAISLGVFDSPSPLAEKYKLKNDWG